MYYEYDDNILHKGLAGGTKRQRLEKAAAAPDACWMFWRPGKGGRSWGVAPTRLPWAEGGAARVKKVVGRKTLSGDANTYMKARWAVDCERRNVGGRSFPREAEQQDWQETRLWGREGEGVVSLPLINIRRLALLASATHQPVGGSLSPVHHLGIWAYLSFFFTDAFWGLDTLNPKATHQPV